MTSPTSTGAASCLTVAEHLRSAMERLDEFEERLGLPARCPTALRSEATRLLAMGPDEKGRLSADECDLAASSLQDFAWWLQRCVNRLQSEVRWCEQLVRSTAGPSLHEMKGQSQEERWLAAVKQDARLQEADRARTQALLRLDRVSFLASRVENMAKSLGQLGLSRRGRYAQ